VVVVIAVPVRSWELTSHDIGPLRGPAGHGGAPADGERGAAGSTGGDRLAGSVVEILRGRRGFEPYAEAGRSRLHTEAEVVDTTHLTTARAAARIAEAVSRAA
jgi:hypothetical protein